MQCYNEQKFKDIFINLLFFYVYNLTLNKTKETFTTTFL